MKITQDSIFKMGSTHNICQDYSLSGIYKNGQQEMPFIIVSDGCSSSNDTDIGARLICHAAKMWVRMLTTADDLEKIYTQFGQSVITSAKTMANAMGLPTSCLDATLIVSFVQFSEATTFIYGDGHVFIQRGDEIYIHTVDFKSGAPYYLSYWIDPGRQKQYHEEFDNDVIFNFELNDGDSVESITNYNTSIILEHGMIDVLNSLTIASDGLSTFYKEGNEPHKAMLVATDIVDYRIGTGEFLKRRAKRVLKNYNKQNIHHSDDLSLAAFFFKREG